MNEKISSEILKILNIEVNGNSEIPTRHALHLYYKRSYRLYYLCGFKVKISLATRLQLQYFRVSCFKEKKNEIVNLKSVKAASSSLRRNLY